MITALRPYEKAITDYYRGETDNRIVIIREDGYEDEIPVRHLFGEPDTFSPIDTKALSLCRGKILDLGAGSGNHSLFLQSMNKTVYALEVLPSLAGLLKERGINNVIEADFFKLDNRTFDTILLLGHGLGLAEDLDGLNRLLEQMKALIKENGIILCDSLDVRITNIPENLSYHGELRNSGRYIGEVRFRFKYKDMDGPPLKWLHVDYETLTSYAERNNMVCRQLLNQENGDYLAMLQLRPGSDH